MRIQERTLEQLELDVCREAVVAVERRWTEIAAIPIERETREANVLTIKKLREI